MIHICNDNGFRSMARLEQTLLTVNAVLLFLGDYFLLGGILVVNKQARQLPELIRKQERCMMRCILQTLRAFRARRGADLRQEIKELHRAKKVRGGACKEHG